MKAVVTATFLLLLVGACAQKMVWYKPDATQADFNRESYECQKDAYATGGAAYMGWGITQRTANADMYKSCMIAHGYSLNAARTQDPGLEVVDCKYPNIPEVQRNAARSCTNNGGTIVR